MLSERQLFAGCICALAVCLLSLYAVGCSGNKSVDSETKHVPHEGRWGVYSLDLASQDVGLIYSTSNEITGIDLNNHGTTLALAIKTLDDVEIDTTSEIYTLDFNTGGLNKLTDNVYFDSYPSFSPDDSSIVFLSMRDNTLDLYVMLSDGSDQRLLYNSGGHDADVDWGGGERIAFTRDNQIWSVSSDGLDPQQVTNPPDAGFWGIANLPMGDYDPRISPGGDIIAFERMVDVSFPHGGYDIFVIAADGSGETNLTNNGSQGRAQGFPNWSHSGDKLVYILTATATEGKYDIYIMNSDGSQNHDITPDYFPPTFLCHNAIFSLDDSKLYFIGQWWQQ
jgi:Tol biopolymer transport system component